MCQFPESAEVWAIAGDRTKYRLAGSSHSTLLPSLELRFYLECDGRSVIGSSIAIGCG